jgi:hypothetical protein
VFAELRGSDVQKISGSLCAAKVASLILANWLGLKFGRSLEISGYQSPESS